mgnify:FL=1
MTNANTPFGLRATVNSYGGQPVVNAYYIPSTYATALFVGDPVVKTGTANSNTIIADREYQPGSLPEINKATAGTTNLITGVILGFAFLPTDLAKTYNPASTERVALVCDDPAQLFEIQCETAGTALAITEIGLNANLVYAESGSTLTGLSGAELDTSTPATTQDFQLKIKRIIDRGDNELGTHAKVLVSINQHTEANNTAGI